MVGLLLCVVWYGMVWVWVPYTKKIGMVYGMVWWFGAHVDDDEGIFNPIRTEYQLCVSRRTQRVHLFFIIKSHCQQLEYHCQP
jgi:hypothetical protein